jgi:hypothetical protein
MLRAGFKAENFQFKFIGAGLTSSSVKTTFFNPPSGVNTENGGRM